MTLSQASNTIVACEGHLTAIVEVNLNEVVFSVTQEKYSNHNVDLINWIYKQDEWRK